jgi:hypothetical protein
MLLTIELASLHPGDKYYKLLVYRKEKVSIRGSYRQVEAREKRRPAYGIMPVMQGRIATVEDDFWTERRELFTAQFPPYYREPQQVHGRFPTSFSVGSARR